jgi:hypothetical protein
VVACHECSYRGEPDLGAFVVRSRRTALALATTVVVIAFVGGVFWLVHSSRNQVDTATVYAVYIAAIALAIPLLTALAPGG